MTTWTGDTKSAQSVSEYDLEIGSSFVLLIDGTYNLLIQAESAGTDWATVSENTATWAETNKS